MNQTLVMQPQFHPTLTAITILEFKTFSKQATSVKTVKNRHCEQCEKQTYKQTDSQTATAANNVKKERKNTATADNSAKNKD